jgi:hypothetical protein
MAETIYFDESGNTGGDLTHLGQPAFVLASHKIEEGECAALLQSHFPRNQAPELKHVNVRQHHRSRQAMVALLRALKADEAPIALYAVHKRFALFQRLFDYLVEPVIHARGVEVGEDAMNIKLTNAGYLAIEAQLGAPFLDRLLDLFQNAVRHGSRAQLGEMWRHLERGRKRRPGVTRRAIDLLLLGRRGPKEHFDGLVLSDLDVAFSTVVALTAHWRRLSEGPFVIIHDETKPLAEYRAVWDWLTSPDQQRATLGFGDFRDLPLPMNVERTEIRRSHEFAGLQLADLLAGAMLEVCRFQLGDLGNEAYARDLIAAGGDEVANNIWPGDAWHPPEGGIGGDLRNPLDFLAEAPVDVGRHKR